MAPLSCCSSPVHLGLFAWVGVFILPLLVAPRMCPSISSPVLHVVWKAWAGRLVSTLVLQHLEASHFASPDLELREQERGFFFLSTVRLGFSLVHSINTELNTCCMLNIPAG